jgi:hypothetical protein
MTQKTNIHTLMLKHDIQNKHTFVKCKTLENYYFQTLGTKPIKVTFHSTSDEQQEIITETYIYNSIKIRNMGFLSLNLLHT